MPVLGLDFGTSTSLCAYLEGGAPSLVPNARGARSTPSVVAATRSGEILVGEAAKNQAFVNPEHTVQQVKRRLGSSSPVPMGGRSWRPEELAALVLGSLRADAERATGEAATRAVLAAPANFSDRERRALAEAGRIAGLEVLKIINEPTAAALARAWASGSGGPGARPLPEGLVLVYDFGGGTFDASLLAREGSECRVLASRGDGRLGGSDLDRELWRRAARSFKDNYGLDVAEDRHVAQALAEQVERAKLELSERPEASVLLPFARAPGSAAYAHPERRFTRAEFEELALPYVDRSLDLCELVLADSGCRAEELAAVVLSGGASRMPLVRRRVLERLGVEPEPGANPEELVALGAAVAAGLSEGEGERAGFRFSDVVSRSYGVEIDGRRFISLIPKNSPVPARRSRVFTTVADRQDSVEIHVLQGESEDSAENLSLGRFLLTGVRPAKAGEPRIAVDFSIDESDMLHVRAKDLDTGAAQSISIADAAAGDEDADPERCLAKCRLLALRVAELREGLRLEGGLESELDEILARATAAGRSGAGGPSGEGLDGLLLLKAELEGLVGELLARRQEASA